MTTATRPPSPYELAREQYAAQLVDDIRDQLAAADCYCKPGDSTCEDWRDSAHRWETLAAAVVRLVYPTLQQVKDRDTPEELHAHALALLASCPTDEELVERVAGLLRDLRRLYDDAQSVRDAYGESCRAAYDERDALLQDHAELQDAVRRIRRIVRPLRTGRG